MGYTCRWCKGRKKIKLQSYGEKVCPNCKGSGEGHDGGEAVSCQQKPWLLGNSHNTCRINGRFMRKER